MEEDWVDWQREATTFKSQQIREVFARFGLAAYCGQCVERQIGLMLATMYSRQFAGVTPEERDRVFDKEFAKTLGRMANDLSEKLDLPPAFEGRLRHAVNRRNWLTHSYFWDRAMMFRDAEAREKMIVELQQLADFFHDFDEELTGVHQMWLDRVGISRELVRKEMNRMIHEDDQVGS